MRLTDLTAETKNAEIEIFEVGTLNVTYCPGKYTPETEDRLQQAIETSRPSAGIAKVLVDIIIDWDLMDDSDPNADPVKIELNFHTLKGLPSAFLVAVSQGITADMEVSRSNRKNSEGGSLQAG